MNRFLNIIRFIWNHPLSSKNRVRAFKNFFFWQLSQAIYKRAVVYPFVEESSLLIQKGMTGATGNIYTGLLEFYEMSFLLHTLRKEDTFADVGANVGVYSILAAKNIGAKVISIEPIPSTFTHLLNNIELNKVSNNVTVLSVGVGKEDAILEFTNTMDSINHVVINSNNDLNKGIIKVNVKKIDDLFANAKPVIMKMDIEGYEWPALSGAKKILASSDLKAIIIELNGCGNLFGFADDDIHNLLLSFNFKPYQYDPFKRIFSLLKSYGNYNTLYIKDLDWATSRVKQSKKYLILGQLV